MSKVTLKDLESQCDFLTNKYLKDKPNREFIIVKSPSGYRLCYYIRDERRPVEISPTGVTKTELYYQIRMFEAGLEFTK